MSRIQRSVRQPGAYFVTSDTWQRRPIFNKTKEAEILLSQILACRERGFYRLHAFAIMPDHFHMLLTPEADTTLEKAVQMIKGGSAYRIRKELSYQFPVWHAGFHDRWIRDQSEYEARRVYIEENAVKAQLAPSPEEYPWSSACGKHLMDPSQFDVPQGLKPVRSGGA